MKHPASLSDRTAPEDLALLDTLLRRAGDGPCRWRRGRSAQPPVFVLTAQDDWRGGISGLEVLVIFLFQLADSRTAGGLDAYSSSR